MLSAGAAALSIICSCSCDLFFSTELGVGESHCKTAEN